MLATLLTLFALTVTAGLGVLALIAVPVAVGLGGTILVERRIRRRRRAARWRARRRNPR